MSNRYTTREAVASAGSIKGTDYGSSIDKAIDAASREIDRITNRRFIPITATRYYNWPHSAGRSPYVLLLDEDLLDTTALTKEGSDATAIADTDYFEEPHNFPPYQWIEIDLASSAFFSIKDTHQQQIRVTGSWGYCNDTVTGGTVISGLADDAAATTFVCSNGALIGVGDTLLIESEQVFVTDKNSAAEPGGDKLNDTAVTAEMNDMDITVVDGSCYSAGEVILVDSERMYIESIATNVLHVKRAHNGTILAAHADETAIHVFRTLTIERGVNGTTAAKHANTKAISVYQPPADIQILCIALALAYLQAAKGGWTGVIGGERPIETRMTGLARMRDDIQKHYRRNIVMGI